MPEYLSPGVYVEETAFRARSIEGVGTGTTAFVGPARTGPCHGRDEGPPRLLTSAVEFERLHGGLADLSPGNGEAITNHMAHAVRAFFQEGGSRLYVVRVVGPGAAVATTGSVEDSAEGLGFIARFPGAEGNGEVVVREHAVPASADGLDAAPPGSLVRTTVHGVSTLLLREDGAWRPAAQPTHAAVALADVLAGAPQLITVSVRLVQGDGLHGLHERMGLHPVHPRWIGQAMAARPLTREDQLHQPCAIHVGTNLSAAALHAGLFEHAQPNAAGERERVWTLAGGQDGAPPAPQAYESALASIAALEDVSIVAAPGSSAAGEGGEGPAMAITRALIAHAAAPRAWRIAVLDTPPAQTPTEARTWRSQLDSTHAALYFPWVVVANPLARTDRDDIPTELVLPPSGFVCGIYARNDVQRGLHKAPANEVVQGALRFEINLNFALQELLNPAGVNCLRYLSGRGHRVWGSRLISSDPEWKYVNQRRYFNHLEASIDRGTQWVAFEPHGERLWANLRETINDFLFNEWRNGCLLGASPNEAFFVRCDRSTMTQDDLDRGQLVCLIGVAMLQPAEFVIFRLAHRTADARA